MAIRGVAQRADMPEVSTEVHQVTEATIQLLKMFDLVRDEQSLRQSLQRDYARLDALNAGRLYITLPTEVSTRQLIAALDDLAAKRHMPGVQIDAYWSDMLTVRSDVVVSPRAQLALYAPDAHRGMSGLLHHTHWPLNRVPRYLTSQRILLNATADHFEAAVAGTRARAADHRDYLVWCLMDMLRGVSFDAMPLANGEVLRIPVLSGQRHDARVACIVQSPHGIMDARGMPDSVSVLAGVGIVAAYTDDD